MKKLMVGVLAAILYVSGSVDAAMLMFKATAGSPIQIRCGDTDTAGDGTFAAAVTSLAYDISTADVINIHVYSDSTSSATVLIEEAPATGGPWGTVATITDPSSTAIGWSIPRANFVRIRISSYSSGNIHACIAAWTGSASKY